MPKLQTVKETLAEISRDRPKDIEDMMAGNLSSCSDLNSLMKDEGYPRLLQLPQLIKKAHSLDAMEPDDPETF